MRITTKTVKVIEVTHGEVDKLLALIKKADTLNGMYAEERVIGNTFIGVQVLPDQPIMDSGPAGFPARPVKGYKG